MTHPKHSVERSARGVTLVELSIVIAIVGIVASLALVRTKSDPTAKSARQLTAWLQEARRLAVAHGPTRSATTAATARLTVSSRGSTSQVQLSRLDDSVVPEQWVASSWEFLPAGAEVFAVAPAPHIIGGGPLPPALDSATAEILFYPDGHADARTFYLQTRDARSPERFRVVVMPLSATAMTIRGW